MKKRVGITIYESAILFMCISSFAFGELFSKRTTCQQKKFGNGEMVCVCNASYCDAIHSLPSFPSRVFNIYMSDKLGSRFTVAKKNFATWVNPKAVKVTVNSSEIFQPILGFGGTLSDAAAINIHSLSQDAQEKLLDSYFSEKGIEYNLVKIPIGGTDFSDHPYTLDDTPGDTSLEDFKLSPEDIKFKIPDLLKIKNISNKNIELMGTAWTAPPWMKTNNDYVGVGVLRDEYFPIWSKYYLRFLEEYEKHGLNFWAITTGYQPSAGLVPFYPYNCMGWTPFSQSQWVGEHLGPDLKRSSFNKTKIVTLDDVRFFLPWWPKLMFNEEKAKNYVNGIGVQWYWDFILPSRLLDLTHALFPDKFILGTEASFNKRKTPLRAVALGSWSRAEEYAESMINDLNHWVSGWIDSNLALNPDGGPTWAGNFADAPLIVNATADEFYKQPMFYVMGHFSKFVPKGSVRIGVKLSKSGVRAVGFRTPQGNVVLVLLNKTSHKVPISILGSTKGNANLSLPKKSIVRQEDRSGNRKISAIAEVNYKHKITLSE